MRATCGEWSESEADRATRIDAALRHMCAREYRMMVRDDRPPREYSYREIGDFVGCDHTMIMRIEKAALATIREKGIESLTT